MSLLRSVRRRSARWGAAAAALTVTAALAAFSLLTPSDAAVTGKLTVSINAQDVRVVGIESATQAIQRAFEWTLAAGTGANQVDQCAQYVGSLGTGAAVTMDFTGPGTPTFSNAFGTASFQKVKLLIVSASSANTTNLTVSRPAGTTGIPLFALLSQALAPLKPGAVFVWTDPSLAGIASTDGSDGVTVTNSAGATAAFNVVTCGIKS